MVARFIALLLLAANCLYADWIGETQVYLTKDQAIEIILKGSEKVSELPVQLTTDQVERIEKRLGKPIGSRTFSILRGETGGQVDAYGLIVEEVGKFRPITFVVGVSPQGEVTRVAIMVYRECRGGEVRHPRFLKQFHGKTGKNPLRINKDILNVTGATLSVIGVTSGVRKALAIVEEVYLKTGSLTSAVTTSAASAALPSSPQ
ncbi:MAG: FMN-binding protein [Planctomycetes bacterium]|nr:FMN-binding protein [Planctomycetota bacterium]